MSHSEKRRKHVKYRSKSNKIGFFHKNEMWVLHFHPALFIEGMQLNCMVLIKKYIFMEFHVLFEYSNHLFREREILLSDSINIQKKSMLKSNYIKFHCIPLVFYCHWNQAFKDTGGEGGGIMMNIPRLLLFISTVCDCKSLRKDDSIFSFDLLWRTS